MVMMAGPPSGFYRQGGFDEVWRMDIDDHCLDGYSGDGGILF